MFVSLTEMLTKFIRQINCSCRSTKKWMPPKSQQICDSLHSLTHSVPFSNWAKWQGKRVIWVRLSFVTRKLI